MSLRRDCNDLYLALLYEGKHFALSWSVEDDKCTKLRTLTLETEITSYIPHIIIVVLGY